ncbi:21131_t:CDS:2, partial [Gigaspora margarita]
PSSSKALTNPLVGKNTHQTIEVLNNLTHFISEIINQTPDYRQPLQPQPTISNLNDYRFLYKCTNFTNQDQLNSISLINSEYLEQISTATHRTQRISKPNSQKTCQALPTQIIDSKVPSKLQQTRPIMNNMFDTSYNTEESFNRNSKEGVDKNNDAINNKLEKNKNATRKDKKNNDIIKEMDKEVPCKIDVEMSELSEEDKSIKTRGSKRKGISKNEDINEDKNDDSWDSDNETVVGNDKKSIEVKNVYDKIWEERVIALVGKKKKEIFQSQETLDKTCKAWLKKVSCF